MSQRTLPSVNTRQDSLAQGPQPHFSSTLLGNTSVISGNDGGLTTFPTTISGGGEPLAALGPCSRSTSAKPAQPAFDLARCESVPVCGHAPRSVLGSSVGGGTTCCTRFSGLRIHWVLGRVGKLPPSERGATCGQQNRRPPRVIFIVMRTNQQRASRRPLALAGGRPWGAMPPIRVGPCAGRSGLAACWQSVMPLSSRA